MTGRLPSGVRPRDVDLRVELDPARSDRFRGRVEIQLELARPRRAIRLQTGYLYHYAFAMLIGVAALVTWYLFVL